jgi:hypothetical protein
MKTYQTMKSDKQKQTGIYSNSWSQVLCIMLLFANINFSAAQTHRWLNHIKGNDETYQFGIELDQSNNLYLSGYVRGLCDFQAGDGVEIVGGPAFYRYYIIKYDPNGEVIWSYAPEEFENSFTNHFTIDESQNAAYVYGTQFGSGFIAKHNLTTGEFEWKKMLKPKFSNVRREDLHKIYSTPNGNIIFTGYTARSIDFDPGLDTVYWHETKGPFITSWSKDGEYLWSHKLIQDDDNGVFKAPDLYISPADELIWAGSFQGDMNFRTGENDYSLIAIGDQDIFMSYYDLDGTWIKTDRLSTVNNNSVNDVLKSLDYDSQNNLYLVTSAAGKMVLNPTTDSIVFDMGFDYAVLKFNANWDLLYRLNIDGFFGYNQVGQIKLHPDDSWSIYASIQGSADIDPHPIREYIINSPGINDKEYFIARYNKQFELEHVFEPYTYISSMCWDEEINFYGALHDRQLDYNINGVKTRFLPDQPHFFDTYLFSETKGQPIVSSTTNLYKRKVKIQPNPVQSNSRLEIFLPNEITQMVKVSINHISGKHISSQNLWIEGDSFSLQLNSILKGVYILSMPELGLSSRLIII